MRRLDLTFSAIQPPLDFLILTLAAISAYTLRFSKFFTEIRPILTDIPFGRFLATAILFSLIWIVLFAIAGLYTLRPVGVWSMMGRVALASTAGIMIVIATVFFSREFQTSRFVILAAWAFSIVFPIIERIILRLIRRLLLRAGIGHQHIVIIGQGKSAQDLASFYKKNPVLGLTVVKTVKTWSDKTKQELLDLIAKHKVDVLLLADPDVSKKRALELIRFAETHHLDFRYLADLFSAAIRRVEVSTNAGLPIIEVKRTPLEGWGRIEKRIFDIFFSLIFLIVFSPIILLAMLALMIEDGLPVIFQNVRVGEKGHEFKLLKLRSMYRKFSIGPQFKSTKENLEFEQELIKKKSIKGGPVYKIAEDPRVTPVGRFIRRWSIDELLQFWNVLVGDMSLVGPRPHQPREVEKYTDEHRKVLAIKPGITGMAQVSGRSDLSFDEEVQWDVWYIENWSPVLDLYILFKTPLAVFARKGAY